MHEHVVLAGRQRQLDGAVGHPTRRGQAAGAIGDEGGVVADGVGVGEGHLHHRREPVEGVDDQGAGPLELQLHGGAGGRGVGELVAVGEADDVAGGDEGVEGDAGGRARAVGRQPAAARGQVWVVAVAAPGGDHLGDGAGHYVGAPGARRVGVGDGDAAARVVEQVHPSARDRGAGVIDDGSPDRLGGGAAERVPARGQRGEVRADTQVHRPVERVADVQRLGGSEARQHRPHRLFEDVGDDRGLEGGVGGEEAQGHLVALAQQPGPLGARVAVGVEAAAGPEGLGDVGGDDDDLAAPPTLRRATPGRG